MAALHISSVEEFKTQILEHKGLSIIDFRAERCGPCRMLGPIMEQLADEHKDVIIAKVNVDEVQQLAATFEVSSIPVVFFIKDGQVVDKVVGVNPASIYKDKITQYTA